MKKIKFKKTFPFFEIVNDAPFEITFNFIGTTRRIFVVSSEHIPPGRLEEYIRRVLEEFRQFSPREEKKKFKFLK